MTTITAGIDPHRDSFTIGIVDHIGLEVDVATFDNCTTGYAQAIEWLHRHDVTLVGVEGSASWGRHIACAVTGAGFDAREVPSQRTAIRRRSRRLAKTDRIDAIAIARALQGEPTLGPVQVLDVVDPLLAHIEAVIEHRRSLVEARTQQLHYAQDQIAKLPAAIRDRLPVSGKIDTRLRALARLQLDPSSLTAAASHRLGWLHQLVAQIDQLRRQIRALERDLDRLLDTHGTTLRDEAGIATVTAATLLIEVGDPTRFRNEAAFARWCGTGAVALSSAEGDNYPVRHRLDFGGNRRINSVLYIMSVTQQRHLPEAAAYISRKRAEGKTRREARRAHKRHLANRVIRRMWKDHQRRMPTPTITAP
jgi:transposase